LPQGLRDRLASSQGYRLPRAKKPSNASTTTMMMMSRMMEKTHPLLTTHVRSVHFDVQTCVPSGQGGEGLL
jgi:hypothetical protein